MAYAYISYCDETRRAAEALLELLERRKLRAWLGAGDMLSGQDVKLREELIRDCACVVQLVPGGEGGPEWTARERELAGRFERALYSVSADELPLTRDLAFLIDYITINRIEAVHTLDETAPGVRRTVRRIEEAIRKSEEWELVRFGRWPLVRDGEPEPLEWRPVREEEGRLLLVSRLGLETKVFSRVRGCAWEDCSLRSWLNEQFLQTAFTEEERRAILETKLPADRNPDYDTDPGGDTVDRVFVLSLSEYKEYFTGAAAAWRCCEPSALARWQGAFAWGGQNGLWWLRTPGDGPNMELYVSADGSVELLGCYAQRGEVCVRPALWVERKALGR